MWNLKNDTDLSTKQKQICTHEEQTYGCQEGEMEWEVEFSRHKM